MAGTTAVSGSKFFYANQVDIPVGTTFYFQPCDPTTLTPIAYQAGGDNAGLRSSAVVQQSVTEAGHLSVTLDDTSLTNPVNVGFLMRADDPNGKPLLGKGYVIQPRGANWSLDTDFVPDNGTLALKQIGPTGLSLYQLYEVNETANGRTPLDLSDWLASQRGPAGSASAASNLSILDSLNAVAGLVQPSPGGNPVFSIVNAAFQALARVSDAGDLSVAGSITTKNIAPMPTNDYGAVFGILNQYFQLVFYVDQAGTVHIPGSASNAVQVPCIDRDGTQYYSSLVGSNYQIVRKDAAGVTTQLTSVGSSSNVTLSGDGTQLVFLRTLGGIPQAYHMDRDGGHQLALGTSIFDVLRNSTPGLITYGQSLSIGTHGDPPLTFAQQFGASLMPQSGVVAGDGSSNGAYTPWTAANESVVPDQTQMNLTSGAVETGWVALCDALSNASRKRGEFLNHLVMAAGQGGQPLAQLSPGTANWTRLTDQITAMNVQAGVMGKPLVIHAIPFDQGENNQPDTNYDQERILIQQQMQALIQSITGQTLEVPLIGAQISDFNTSANVSLGILKASIETPALHICTGPKYEWPTYDVGHLLNYGYRGNGLMTAKYLWRKLTGQSTKCLYPRSTERYNNQLLIRFWVPSGSLAWDTTLVSDPAIAGEFRGFKYTDDSGSPPTITSGQIYSADSVLFTLSGTPTGNNRTIQSALTFDPARSYSGPLHGPRCCLRTDDPGTDFGIYNDSTGSPYLLSDWCAHSSTPVF